MAEERWGIAANVIDDKVFRRGAKVRVWHNVGDSMKNQVRGISKGGRVVTKWLPIHRLEKFRARFSANPDRDFAGWYKSKDAANAVATNLNRWADEERARRQAKPPKVRP